MAFIAIIFKALQILWKLNFWTQDVLSNKLYPMWFGCSFPLATTAFSSPLSNPTYKIILQIKLLLISSNLQKLSFFQQSIVTIQAYKPWIYTEDTKAMALCWPLVFALVPLHKFPIDFSSDFFPMEMPFAK